MKMRAWSVEWWHGDIRRKQHRWITWSSYIHMSDALCGLVDSALHGDRVRLCYEQEPVWYGR